MRITEYLDLRPEDVSLEIDGSFIEFLEQPDNQALLKGYWDSLKGKRLSTETSQDVWDNIVSRVNTCNGRSCECGRAVDGLFTSIIDKHK